MDQRLKERLVGMSVLLLVGIVVIPFILDGDQTSLQAKSESTHTLDFTNGNIRKIDLPVPDNISIEQVEVATADSVLEESKKPQQSQKITETVAESKKTEIKKADPVKPKPVKVEPAKSESIDVESKIASTVKKSNQQPIAEVSPEPVLTASQELDSSKSSSKSEAAKVEQIVNDPGAAWVVQIGSFGERNNAEKQIEELKRKGFPAFLRRYVKNDKQALYRVRVGPEKDRVRAEKLSERLTNAGFKGQIVPDP